MKARPDSLAVVCLLTAVVALGPVSTDLYLPSLPAIGRSLEATTGEVQLTLSVFMAGFAISQLAYGPLADRFGRRPVLLGGLAIYFVATLACFLAPSIEWLIAARFVQAVGACAGPVLGRAVVRDVFGRDRSAQVLSYLAMAMALAPAVAPIIGGYLEVLFGWRSNFAALLLLCVLLALTVVWILPETNRHKDPNATRPARLLANYRSLSRDNIYRGYVVTLSLAFSGLFAFISGSAFVLIDIVGLAPDQFGLSFAVIVVGYMVGTFASARLTRRLGHDRMIAIGLAAALAGALPMAAFAFMGVTAAVTIIAPMTVVMGGVGMVLPNGMAGAVGPFPQMAGSASALLGFVQMGLAALAGIAVGQLADGTARPMAGMIALTSVLSVASYISLARRKRAMAAETPGKY